MNHFKRGIPITLCVAAAALSSTAVRAQDTASTCKSVTGLQKRIVERADQGIDSLRAFVWTTNIVHGIDMWDVRESLDTWRAAVECRKQVAQAAEKADVSGTQTASLVAESDR